MGDKMYLSIITRTLFLYFFIILIYRIMGKKEVGKLSIVDLIVSVLVAELAALSIERDSTSIFMSIVPMIVLVLIQIILGFVTLKSSKIRKFIDGKESVIIKDGKLNFNEMTKLRYSLDDLLVQLREQQVKSIEDVKYAILENNGKLSVFDNEADYPLPIIVDGVIDYDVLRDIKKDYKWVSSILKEKNIELKNVFYAFHTKKKTFIIKRSDLLWKPR